MSKYFERCMNCQKIKIKNQTCTCKGEGEKA